MTDKLLLETHPDGVAVLTINRPAAHNALDHETMHAFANAVNQLAQAADLRALIVTGGGSEAFCSGGDLVEFSQYPSAEEGLSMITLMGDTLLALERLPVPVIAAINGYALGGGSELALACDIRIADEKVRMGFVQVKMALTPGWGAGQRLLRLLGYSQALDLLLTGHVMPPHELLARGLVNRLVDPGTALLHALSYARHVASFSPDVIRSIKQLLQSGLTQPYEAALQTERALFPPLWAAEAHLQAVASFLNRTRETGAKPSDQPQQSNK